MLSGYLGQLPHEALEHILGYLGPTEIGLMETTCRYFLESGVIEQVARHNLKSIPRAKGLTPMFLYVDPFCLSVACIARLFVACITCVITDVCKNFNYYADVEKPMSPSSNL